MSTVFVLQHVNTLPSGEEDVKLIGVFRTTSSALMAVEQVKTQPGFRNHPNIVGDGDGFYLSEYKLDQVSWSEGFVTMVGDEEYDESKHG